MKIINGNNIELLKEFPDNYFDAIVTDPPYGLGKEPNAELLMKDWIEKGYHEVGGSGFMGKEWDAFVPQPIFWKEVFRVLKHGGHVLAFYGTRTYDWGVMAMRFAGFEVRDCIQWLYGSGFPKSHNVGKAVDSLEKIGKSNPKSIRQIRMGENYEPTGQIDYKKGRMFSSELQNDIVNNQSINNEWEGWGSALKPAHEDLVLARKPFQFSSDFVYLYENIVYNLKLQICQSKLFAKDVKEIFTLSQKELQGVELDFAQWSVGKPFNTMEDLLVLMDMLQLELKEGNTTLNIVLLWLNTLVELWNVANTYTTEMESSTITELRILNSLEWESIFQNITLLKNNKTNGLIANVLTVESLFSVLNLKLNDILTHFAKENVTLKESEKNFVPNSEQIVLARKPLEKGLSIAENVLKWGVGAINIDRCRVGSEVRYNPPASNKEGGNSYNMSLVGMPNDVDGTISQGRFPANLILTHHPECECVGIKKVKSGISSEKGGGFGGGLYRKDSSDNIGGGYGEETIEDWNCHEDCPIKILDEQSGETKSSQSMRGEGGGGDKVQQLNYRENSLRGHNDKGGASRFFYVAKASKSERNKGLEGFEEKQSVGGGGGIGDYVDDVNSASGKYGSEKAPNKNFHPTVKPIKLMQYLVRLVTPPNGIVLDPFCGSGTTGVACKLEGFDFVGLEQDAEYSKIAQARIENYVEDNKVSKSTKKEISDNDTQLNLF